MTTNVIGSILLQLDQNESKEDWYATLMKVLDGVNAELASWQPGGSVNTIWQTLRHMNYYNNRVLSTLKGEALPNNDMTNEATFGAPGDPTDDIGFQNCCEQSFEIYKGIRKELEKQRKNQTMDDKYVHEYLPLWTQHDAYHIGQIVVLRKLREAW
ncbi:DinB family protein [Paenibacillus sp. Marseille-Q4541]|uniref:DinB family protein n=1 Tax=Paenibacillus sp. Marseille-Q4541 TaxID=2831522 RepID=UPI001BA52EBE|nr:DinB family protein [Paenibacillus sp. Marseille-Q4541]